jgi:nucleoid-associated protein YgaU
MEYWLIQDSDKLRLPVPPADYGIKTANNNSTFTVEGMGEVSFIGKPKLAEIEAISSFFPSQNYSFCQYTGFPTPSDCVTLIEKWRLSGKPIIYIITGTLVNILCSIESFEWKEQDGTGDIYFTLELKEYRVINSPSQTVSSTANTLSFSIANNLVTTVRVTDKTVPTTYTIKSGDTLYTIAKKIYGDGSKWQTIASNNVISDPTNLTVGQVITL